MPNLRSRQSSADRRACKPQGSPTPKGGAEMYLVSLRTFLRWADSGIVPAGVKIGGRRLWRIADLDAHIQKAGGDKA